MMTQPLSATLIERYLRTRGRRYFRGQHDGEFFFVADMHLRRLHVHLEISPAHPDVLTIRVAPACFFPAADYAWLAQFADTWNEQHRDITAIVHGSSDPRRIGVEAQQCRWFTEEVTFEDFAEFVDRTITAAIDLFAGLAPVPGLTSTTRPLVLDVG